MTIAEPIALAIFLIIGIIINFLFSGTLLYDDWKYYKTPHIYLALSIFLLIMMPYAFTICNLLNNPYYSKKVDLIPPLKKIRGLHDCKEYSSISFEETYEDDKGNITTEYNPDYIHHTHRVWTCNLCGNKIKEQLQ